MVFLLFLNFSWKDSWSPSSYPMAFIHYFGYFITRNLVAFLLCFAPCLVGPKGICMVLTNTLSISKLSPIKTWQWIIPIAWGATMGDNYCLLVLLFDNHGKQDSRLDGPLISSNKALAMWFIYQTMYYLTHSYYHRYIYKHPNTTGKI